jgi:type I site-specific restriction endonuclease
LDAYPSKLVPFTTLIDRALKTILFTVTQGHAKQLISSADSAYQGLIDLKRHCAQTSTQEKHLERQKLIYLSQNYGEKASEFLKKDS